MGFKCLCWNCGKEIYSTEPIHKVNEELWCSDCAAPLATDDSDCDYDEEPV